MVLLSLALLGCSEVSIYDNLDAPVVAFLLPTAEGTFDPTRPVDVCAKVDFDGELANLDVVLLSDVSGTLATSGFSPCDGGDFGITVPLQDAAQVLSITVTDGADRSSTDTVSIRPTPNLEPSCEILSPAAGSILPVGVPFDLTVRVEDDDGGMLDVSVESSVDGLLAESTVDADTTPRFPLDLTAGTHNLVVLVEDARGGTDVCVTTVTVAPCQDVDGDGVDTCAGDCDDGDATVNPAAPEIPDGQDNDCDGIVDEGSALYDDDLDGFSELAGDCDDTDPDLNPAATEIPDDGIDQDCSGADTVTCYEDLDGDGYGSTTTVLAPSGDCDGALRSAVSTDCDDTAASVNPGAAEVPGDGIDQDCNGIDPSGCFQDLDGDGYGSSVVLPPGDGDCDDPGESSFGTDCNDNNPAVNPGATEILDDGIDQDCTTADRVTCYTDVDLDGYAGATVVPEEGSCTVGASSTTDCDDLDADVNPGATELPDDGIDQDCDGNDATRCFEDLDFDGYGSLVEVIALDGSCDTSDNEADDDDDCDDTAASVYPGAPEVVLDGIDQDCDGVDAADCFVDLDGDGWGTNATVASTDADCTDPGEAEQNGDCDDDAILINPASADIADDGIDQDCSGTDTVTCFQDLDRDGFGSLVTVLSPTGVCLTVQERSTVDTDCDDTNAAIAPNRTDLPDDGIDQDCSGAGTVTCYVDADGDGFGATPVLALDGSCDAAQNEASVGGDCADGNAQRFPGNPEILGDGIDQDCSGADAVTCYVDTDNDEYGAGAPQTVEGTCGNQLAAVNGDCANNNPNRYPGALEIVGDGIDQDCSGTDSVACFRDLDRDGYGAADVVAADGSCDASQDEAPLGGDCADGNPARNPGATEIPNDNIDQDCSGEDTVRCYTDVDQDDYGVGVAQLREGTCGALAPVDGDCNDGEASAFPGGTEILGDGIDQDCSGTDSVACFRDTDRDGYGDVTVTATDGSCDLAQDEASVGGDCAPGNAAIHPGASEVVGDGIDQDCSGADSVRCYTDVDQDDYGVGGGQLREGVCGNLAPVNGDCADNNPNRFPGNTEILGDGIDQDCSGADSVACFTDLDNDEYGVGVPVAGEGSCGNQLALVAGDCDDSNSSRYPTNPEVLGDGIDQDCNMFDAIACFEDLDQDTWGSSIVVVAADGVCDRTDFEADRDGDCDDTEVTVNPAGNDTNATDGIDANCDGVDGIDADGDGVASTTDCDDNDPDVYPGGPEVRDQADNNCDGQCDEGFIFPGDLVITEIMIDPSAVADSRGEWFEIYNTTSEDIALCGWSFVGGGSHLHEVVDNPIVQANSYFIAGPNDALGMNGGVLVDYVYAPQSLLPMGNNGDELFLFFEGMEIDGVVWPATFDTSGRSQQLSLDELAGDNNNLANWCNSTTAWPGSAGDRGSPGAANAICP